MEWLRLSLLLLVFLLVEIHGQRDQEKATSDGLKLVCYYSNWAVYRPGLAKFTPQNINPYLCTHLIYAFGILSHEFELTSFDPYNDIEQGNYKTFVGLKAYNPDLRTLISVGGWSEGSKKFSKLVESDQLRQKFIHSVLNFVRLHGFDGLDLDWEYPTFREGGNSTDKKGYAQLIKELRLAIDTERVPPEKNRLILSVAVPATKNYIDNGFDVPVIAKNADFLNLLTYDYHNAYEPATQHHAPLFPLQNTNGQDILNVEWTVNYYLQLGCPKEKMVIGIPMYGRSYTLANPIGSTDLGALSEGPGEEGHATRERGYMAFYEVCQRVKDEEWEVETPYPQLMGPYAFKGNQWVGFDDEEMISLKARYILNQGLGGAMVWTLDNDDFRGICTDEQSPLVNTLRTALLYSNVIEGSSSQQLVARSAGPDTPPASIVFDSSGQRNDGSTAPARRNTLRRLVQSRQTARRNRHDRPTGRHVNNDQKSENSFTTPVPPTTPDPGFTFECKDEGFFNNPKDCKKYFWCLDSGPANLGVVAHAFTCPSGLYFNAATESCDYPENVVCRNKPKGETVVSAPQSTRLARPRGRGTTTPTTPKTTTTPLPEDEEEYEDEEEEEDRVTPVAPNKIETRKGDEASEGENVAELLRLLQAIGGVDKLQSLLGSHGSSNQNLQSQILSNYSTPRRTTASDLRHMSTQKPNFESGFNRQADTKLEPEEPSPTLQVPRRPQYVAEPAKHSRVSNNEPFFNYQEPPRKLDNEDNAHADDSDFPFKYRVPTRGQDAVSGVEYVEDEDGDIADGLYEAPPIRQTPKSTQGVPNVSETPLVEPGTGQRGNYRAPIRVQVVRIPNSSPNDNVPTTGVRRRMRVRVRPGGGRIVDDAPVQPHQGRAISRDEHMSAAAAIPAQPHQGRAISRNEHTVAFVQPHQGRAISRDEHKSAAAAARAVLVHDPNVAFHARSEGEPRVTVRRKPGVNNYNNGTGVSRVVTRSRRPGGDNLLNHVNKQGHNPQPEGNYIAVRRVHAATSRPQTTHQTYPTRSSTVPSTREPSITVRAGYQPPLNKPSDTVDYKKNDEALTITKDDVSKVDDYDDEYEEYDDYEDEETTQAPTTTTTKRTTTTTTKRPQRSRSNSRPLSSRRNRFSTSVSAAVTQSTTFRSTSTSRPNSKPTQSRTRTSSTARPHTTVVDDVDEIGVIVRSDDDVECNKRGVFIHPTECSKFVVCAPSSRSVQTLRGRVLFCPANQIYLKDSGRCMKGDRNKCEKL